MTNNYYKKIFDLLNKRAKKLNNSFYFENLTGLIESVATRIDSGKYFCFGSEYYVENISNEPNSSYEQFISQFMNSFVYSSSDKIHIIRGKAGVGKTLFFKKGIQNIIKKQSSAIAKYVPLGVDFINIDSEEKISFYFDLICDQLKNNAIDAIRRLYNGDISDFVKERDKYYCGIDDSLYAVFFPIKYFCEKIFSIYNKPCIIIFDNIDLSCVMTQKRVFKATVNFCKKFNEFMESENVKDIYRIYFAMRPETYLHSEEAKLGNVINFPLPNILAISLEVIKRTLYETANEFDKKEKLKCEVEYYSVIDGDKAIAKNFYDVADYIIRILYHFLIDLWKSNDFVAKRLGTNEEFHCNIVNYNVRTFLSFFADTLCNGGFKPLTTDYINSNYGFHYSVYDYIEMIIRGRWTIHPGNKHIDGEGGNKAPIIFNVFDDRLWKKTQEEKIQHFMLYLRILEFFALHGDGEEILYDELDCYLRDFYKKEIILAATQELVYVRILYSFYEGDENIASKQSYKEVKIDEQATLKLSTTGIFYLENLMCEFEYLYQMALSSNMPEKYVDDLANDWKTEKEKVVLWFLYGIFEIIKSNIDDYKERGVLSSFKAIFCQDNENICKPYRRMVASFIDVLTYKISHAKNKNASFLENKLRPIFNKALDLQSEISTYFSEELN